MALAGDMFQYKIDEIFKELPNVLGIGDYILIVSYDDDRMDHNRKLRWVMKICHKESLKLEKKINAISGAWRSQSSFFIEIISKHGVQQCPHKLCVLKDMPPSNNKKKSPLILSYHDLLWIILTINYRGVWATGKKINFKQNWIVI